MGARNVKPRTAKKATGDALSVSELIVFLNNNVKELACGRKEMGDVSRRMQHV